MISHKGKANVRKFYQNSGSVSTCVASVYGVGELMSTVRLGNISASIFASTKDSRFPKKFSRSEDRTGQGVNRSVNVDRLLLPVIEIPAVQRWAGLHPPRARQQKLVRPTKTRTPIQPQDTSTVQRLLNHFHAREGAWLFNDWWSLFWRGVGFFSEEFCPLIFGCIKFLWMLRLTQKPIKTSRFGKLYFINKVVSLKATLVQDFNPVTHGLID